MIYTRIDRIIAALCVAVVGLAVTGDRSWAGPSISRGEQYVTENESLCVMKGRSAFAREGWSNIFAGRTFVSAQKGAFSAYITCNASARGGAVVNIFVASSNVPDNIPGDPNPNDTLAGAARVALQNQMQSD